MSVNSTSNSSVTPSSQSCDNFPDIFYITCALNATRASTVLPLSIFILYLTLKRRRRQQSFFVTSNHLEAFTFHMAVMEMTWLFGMILYYCARYAEVQQMITAGFAISAMAYNGGMFFNLLTCIERYIAVIHPITYLGLRKGGGIRIRNISVGCVWVLSFGLTVFTGCCSSHDQLLPFLLMFVIYVIVVSFCCFSVLCVLIRPGVEEVGVAKRRVDPKKQRAFCTMLVITVVLLLWLSMGFCANIVGTFNLLSPPDKCRVWISVNWFGLPGSLLLPLLYLHTARKLPFSCHNNK